MGEFTTHKNTFEEALGNLGKVLQICEDCNLSLNNDKYFVMIQEGVVKGHYISPFGIQVDMIKKWS